MPVGCPVEPVAIVETAAPQLSRPHPKDESHPGAPRSAAVPSSIERIVLAVAPGLADFIRAAQADTCGVDIDVPLASAYPPSFHGATMRTPGAVIATEEF